MSAAKSAMAAAEIARGAAQQARAAAEAQRQEAARREQERQQAIYDAATVLLQRSPLGEWFPGQKWRWIDFLGSYYHEYVVAPAETSKGDPDYFTLRLYERDGEVRVDWVNQNHSDGYTYWTGSRVTSALQIGECLLSREERRR